MDDILFTVFRHKRMIILALILGLLAAGAVRLLRPPQFMSQAKLMIRYVADNAPTPASNPESMARPLDFGSLGVINAEIEVLTSGDVATNVAAMVGPERILAKKGGGSDLMSAAGVVASGITVDPPRTTVISVTFKHPDKDLVQPVLDAILTAYMWKHRRMHDPNTDEYYRKEQEELKSNLTRIEDQIQSLKQDAHALFPDEKEATLRKELELEEGKLLEAQMRLAVLREKLPSAMVTVNSNSPSQMQIPGEKAADYSAICQDLAKLEKEKREALRKFRDAHPTVMILSEQIAQLRAQKQDLEKEYPSLGGFAMASGGGGTNATGSIMGADLGEMANLNATVAGLINSISNITAQATQFMSVKPKLDGFKREHDDLARRLEGIQKHMDNGLINADGKLASMGIVQHPSPPKLDMKKMLKLLGMAFGGCVGLGLGLAFLFDMVVDRTIKRSVEIERHLQLPVFLTIPDTGWNDGFKLSWKLRKSKGSANGSDTSPSVAVAPWNPDHNLQMYSEGLRERVMTYFEIKNMNLKKPKLVALTGCGKGAGVTTLASGLAAALSKTGEGNVLLVDMNVGEGVARSFHKGKPGVSRDREQAEDFQAFAELPAPQDEVAPADQASNKIVKVEPNQFASLGSKLRTSDYDYVIFDLPPVSQMSPTPRLAGHMDIVLMVFEAGKTGQQLASKASALMRESKANMAAVLNKYRRYVPAQLSQDL